MSPEFITIGMFVGLLIGLFLGLMGSIFAGLVFYGSFSFFIRSPELENVLAVVKKSMRIK